MIIVTIFYSTICAMVQYSYGLDFPLRPCDRGQAARVRLNGKAEGQWREQVLEKQKGGWDTHPPF